MKAPSVKPVRCAIYTRVSTDHGLERKRMQGQKRLHFPIERDLSPRDITAYKKGLMLARQAAQPSCQLRWCGGGALGKQ